MLVARQLVDDDVRLHLLYLNGLTPADAAKRLDLEPLALPELHGVALTDPVTDGDLARVLDAVTTTKGEPMFDRLASEIADVTARLDGRPEGGPRVVTLSICVRRFICDNPDCPQRSPTSASRASTAAVLTTGRCGSSQTWGTAAQRMALHIPSSPSRAPGRRCEAA